MTIGFLVELLLPKSIINSNKSNNNNNNGKDWIKKKLRSLASLLGKLSKKALESLPAILGAIVSFLLNLAKSTVGFLANNIWLLITGFVTLLYYMITKK